MGNWSVTALDIQEYYTDLGTQIMMGPSCLGSTRTINGTYEILYKLDILARWGTETYRAWFRDSVLGWFRNRIDQCENL